MSDRLRLVWRLGLVLLALQLAGLIAYSRHLWDRFDLTADFATFAQAWSQIGRGHLDPRLTTFAFGHYPHYGSLFWQSHFELLMWPLALLHVATDSAFVLLVVQDMALVGSLAIVLRWGLELLGARWPAGGLASLLIGFGLLIALVINPWVYWTASFDFHFEPIAVCFTLAAARDLWAGRRRAWWWVAIVLLCGEVAAIYLVALGLGALLARSSRRSGAGFIIVGLAWFALSGALGAGRGSTLSESYGYLAGGGVGAGAAGLVDIGSGLLSHPSRASHVLRPRQSEWYKYLASTGTLGVLSAVALPLTVIVLGENLLNARADFVNPDATFQDLMVVLATAIGAIFVLTWVARRGRWGSALASVLAVAMLVQALIVSHDWTERTQTAFLLVPGPTASALAAVKAETPATAEVVASQGVVGRFGDREWVYPYYDYFPDGQTLPVHTAAVVFVFTDFGLETANAKGTARAVALLNRLHARRLVDRAGATAFLWAPPPGATWVTLPPG